ncbi:hypothetical protein [Nonlabens marinus]|uniref:Uncharacterized protein n=1 Tax=Nonlabens marinus S1-08 TaxID=1454201 RepID=W8VPS1_9FLAO|nr:hypothetical protein [Nonlabens marinus]BAO54650.1 hypothetical protein NMS_0641 [Nonlabens marinus S1-08]
MKYLLLLALLFLCNLISAQDAVLTATNSSSSEIREFQENRSIRVVTNDGERYNGRWTAVSADSISIDSLTLALTDLKKIKAHPKLFMALQSTAFVFVGTVSGLVGIALTGFAPIVGIPILGGSIAIIYAGITGMNIFKGYKTKDGWEYSITISKNTSNPTSWN